MSRPANGNQHGPAIDHEAIPLAEQIAELDRTLALRRSAFPALVRRGEMGREVANRRIRALAEAKGTLERLVLQAGLPEKGARSA